METTKPSTTFSGEIYKDTALQTQVIQLKSESSEGKESQVRIAPDLGSNLFQFRVNGNEIIYADQSLLKENDWTGCFVLWPYPNRIRGKEYEFEDQTISLKGITRKHGNFPLVHGLVDDQVWQYEQPVVGTDNVSVTTSFHITPESPLFQYFPFESSLHLEYVLTDTSVRINYSVENKSDARMPFGFALHPYFSTLSGLEKTRVVLPANAVMVADTDLLPTGELKPVEGTIYDLRKSTAVKDLQFDDVFTDLHRGEDALIEYPEQHMTLHLTASEDFTHLVLYTMERGTGFVCLENQSGSTDMINLHTKGVKENSEALKKAAHLLTLEPKQTHKGFIEYRVEHTNQ